MFTIHCFQAESGKKNSAALAGEKIFLFVLYLEVAQLFN